MTINYQELVPKIRELAQAASLRKRHHIHLMETAWPVFSAWAGELNALRDLVDKAAAADPTGLRCARPISEALDTRLISDTKVEAYVILAADGSQILPDRHAEVYYGLINVGGIALPWGIEQPPTTTILSELVYGDELENISEARLALRRDMLERQMILRLGQEISSRCVALSDGPLELWIGREGSETDRKDFQHSLELYFELLEKLYEARLLYAGYVDRPDSNYVVRLLELAMAEEKKVANFRTYHPLQGLSDADLYRQVLHPGERSAVFALHSAAVDKYPLHSAICFFYMNVGTEKEPSLARVEIPSWMTQELDLINFLQSALAGQCRLTGVNTYPYVLHRAHELALVRLEEKEQVTRMILSELQRMGLETGRVSHKQALKNLAVRSTGRLRRSK
ncbi:MAG: DNA double-strand break repair nuclease NurA [Chloroflexota bacterium]